jgi:2-oxoglutarate ferredoxin oxidoreductase subunit beta
MNALVKAFEDLQIPQEEIVFISGIGCSSRIPGYFDVYGFNTIHGRSLPIAQGVKYARPELTVVVATGDGDGLAIGAGHFMNAGRRNPDITMIIFDNEVYGLTKGQASPTSPHGEKMLSSSFGVIERQVSAVEYALTAGATFVARGFSGQPKHLKEMLKLGIGHKGFSVVHTLTPCPTFRGGANAFKRVKDAIEYLPDDHETTNRLLALERSEMAEKIRLGVFYEDTVSPDFSGQLDSLIRQARQDDVPPVEEVLHDFIFTS